MTLVAFTAVAAGVAPRGEIALRVSDAQAQPLRGVTVTLLDAQHPDVAIGRPQITPGTGDVRFSNLPQGRYLVRCEMTGFISETLGPLPIELKEQSPRLPERIDVVLPAGPIWYHGVR
jgi:hypothetical protein